MGNNEALTCPFCEFRDHDAYFLVQHVETCHPENDESPFVARDDDNDKVYGRHVNRKEAGYEDENEESEEESEDADDFEDSEDSDKLDGLSDKPGKRSSRGLSDVSSSFSSTAPSSSGPSTPRTLPDGEESIDPDNAYVECPLSCGEVVILSELNSHLDMHSAENMELDSVMESDEIIPTGVVTGPSKGKLDRQPKMLEQDHEHEHGHGHGHNHDHDHDHAHGRRHGRGHRKKHRAKKSKDSESVFEQIKNLLHSPSSAKGKFAHTEVAQRKIKGESQTNKQKTSDLGPHATEKRMPNHIRQILLHGARVTFTKTVAPNGSIIQKRHIENHVEGLIPIIYKLLQQDKSVMQAYICHPSVQHVHKLPKEGGFCGYRNIQMIIPYGLATNMPGFEIFNGEVPDIFRIQELIEKAWDNGFQTHGRQETGGILGTRKYIGSPEVQAMFEGLGIPHEVRGFGSTAKSCAFDNLWTFCWEYFSAQEIAIERVMRTNKPPIYLQFRGHSLTIIGVELRSGNYHDILIFDPAFKPSHVVVRMLRTGEVRVEEPRRVLRSYRRDRSYLSHKDYFETVVLKDERILH